LSAQGSCCNVKNGKERKAAVTKQAREWRIDLIDRWLAWAFDKHGELGKLGPEFTRLVRATMTMDLAWSLNWVRVDHDAAGALAEFQQTQAALQLADVRWVQASARLAFEFIAGPVGRTWTLPMPESGAIALTATRGKSGFTIECGSGIKAVGAKAIEAVILNSEILRVKRCTEPGCETLYVQRKAGHHCPEHATSDARARRFLASLTPEQKTARRRKYYLGWLKKHRPDHYRHVTKSGSAGARRVAR
jgi:hypothetical protein